MHAFINSSNCRACNSQLDEAGTARSASRVLLPPNPALYTLHRNCDLNVVPVVTAVLETVVLPVEVSVIAAVKNGDELTVELNVLDRLAANELVAVDDGV